MTFLTPLIAGIAAAIAIPSLVILYFLKLRRRELEVSTTLLWKKAIQDLQANAPFQRLRRNILLILQLLVLGGALFAVAQPELKGDEFQNARQIILIDRSASMSALDGDGPIPDSPTAPTRTRFEVAKEEARKLVDSLPEAGIFTATGGAEAMVIAYDVTAEVRQQFTSDKALLKAAIDAIQPTDAPTLMGEAMRLAKAHSPKRGIVADPLSGEKMSIEGIDAGIPVTIHIWSDGKVADLADVKPGLSDEVIFHRVGQPDSANLGVVGLRWERSYEDPTKLSIFTSVQSTFPQARSVDIELAVDGQVAGIKSLELPAAEIKVLPGQAQPATDGEASQPSTVRSVTPATSGVVFQITRSEGAVARVRLRASSSDTPPPGDALESDNVAFLVIPPAKKLAVAAVTRGNLFLAAALQGLPLAKLDTLTPDQYEQKVAAKQTAEYDVIILDGWLPGAASTTPSSGGPAAGSAPALPPGRYLILGAVPPGMGITETGSDQPGSGDRASTESVFIDWSRDHPILRNLTLDPVIIAESRPVTVERGSGAVAIAQTSRGPGIVDASSSDGQWRAIVVPFDIAKSNWPFDVSFVVFMASAVDYLGGAADSSPVSVEAGKLPQGMVQPGSVLSDRLPLDARNARIAIPPAPSRNGSAGQESLTVAADGRIVFGPISHCGVYEVEWVGSAGPADALRDGRALRPYAANLMDSPESDVASSDELALASKVVQARAAGSQKTDRKLWPWFLLGALAVVMLEWFVYNRKVHV
ncbi:MAG: BatA and WFA domain-containing protein [Phycisphaerales bacterium]|nr:BatA and WFA domain-containing protein [Phycisphaerales bacterium]